MDFLTINEAVKALKDRGFPVSSNGLRQGIKHGRIPHYRLYEGGRVVRIPVALVIDVLEGRQVPASWFRGMPPAVEAAA